MRLTEAYAIAAVAAKALGRVEEYQAARRLALRGGADLAALEGTRPVSTR